MENNLNIMVQRFWLKYSIIGILARKGLNGYRKNAIYIFGDGIYNNNRQTVGLK